MPYSPRNPTNDQKAQTDDFINTKNSHNNGSYSQNGTGNGASKFYRTNPQSEYNFQKSQGFYNYPGASFDHGHVKTRSEAYTVLIVVYGATTFVTAFAPRMKDNHETIQCLYGWTQFTVLLRLPVQTWLFSLQSSAFQQEI